MTHPPRRSARFGTKSTSSKKRLSKNDEVTAYRALKSAEAFKRFKVTGGSSKKGTGFHQPFR